MTLFVDTSALAKRYVAETGSAWLTAQIAPKSGNSVIISALARIELIAAISRREKGGSLSRVEADAARTALHAHCAREYLVVRLIEAHLLVAEKLAEKHALRAADSIHLATALELRARFSPKSLVFVSADAEQLGAAASEGLAVENPNVHT